ncbi:hypothetical protein RQP46_009157 [Phenoliferia psychrophenolica]
MSANPVPGGPPKLQNLYYARQVGTAKACCMCLKDTTSCLSNADVTDFLYACPSHLSDPGFARPAPSTTSTPASPSIPQSEIDKVKAEFEERQRKKKEAASSDKDKDKNDKASWLSTGMSAGMSGLSTLASTTKDFLIAPPSSAPPSPTLPAVGAAATSKVFVLHRNIFQMRVDANRKAWQTKEAKERAKQLALPATPRGIPGGRPPPARA